MFPSTLSVVNAAYSSNYKWQEESSRPKQEKQTLLYCNPLVPKENFLAKIASVFFNDDFLLKSPWFDQPLPKLGEEQVSALTNILKSSRTLKGNCDGAEIYVTFTLEELFKLLLKKFKGLIQRIELVGSSVPWILNPYIYTFLKNMGIENPAEWIPEALRHDFAKAPRDFDFRIYAPNANLEDIKLLRESLIDFLVEIRANQSPLFSKSGFRHKLVQSGFNILTTPKDLDENIMSTVGVYDITSNCGIDIVIYQLLNRESLFIYDALFLPIDSLVLEETPVIIIPRSDFGGGAQAIIDRLSGIARAQKPETINCLGWPSLLIAKLKGKRCLFPDLEQKLLNKIISTIDGTKNHADCPKDLLAILRKLPKDTSRIKKMAVVISFWLTKAMKSHLNGDPKMEVALTLQACLSLKQHGFQECIPDVWLRLCPEAAEIQVDPLLDSIFQIMNSDKNGFTGLLALLEVNAFLHLRSSAKDAAFSVQLIMHNQQPAIQVSIQGMPLLLPYNPFEAIKTLKSDWQHSLDKLHIIINPKIPYTHDNSLPVFKIDISEMPSEFSKPEDKLAGEWLLACGIQNEDFLLTLLLQYPELDQRTRLLKSAENLNPIPEKNKLYRKVLSICSMKGYDKMSIVVLWALGLASCKESFYTKEACELWKAHAKEFDIRLAKPFLLEIISVRHDLAAELLPEMAEQILTPEEALNCFEKIVALLRNDFQRKNKKLLFLTQALRHILNKQYKNVKYLNLSFSQVEDVQWVLQGLIWENEFDEIKSLWILIYHYIKADSNLFKELLQKPFLKHTEILQKLLQDQSLSENLSNYLSMTSYCKSVTAFTWNAIFNKLKPAKAKDLWLKASDVFSQYLENNYKLQGTDTDVSDAWISSVNILVEHSPFGIKIIFGKEEQLLSQIKDSSIKIKLAHFILKHALDVSEDQIDNLWKCRLSLAAICQAPIGKSQVFKIADVDLAKKISTSMSAHWQIEAFKIFASLDETQEAGKILISLLQQILTKEDCEGLLLTVQSYLPKVIKENNALTLKILQAQNTGQLFKLAPNAFLNLLNQWDEKNSLISMHHALALMPLAETSVLIPWKNTLFQFFESQHSLHSKFNLSILLANSFEKISEVIENSETLKFLSAYKNHNIRLYPTLELYEKHCREILSLIRTQNVNELLNTFDIFIWLKSCYREKKYSLIETQTYFDFINCLSDFVLTEKIDALTPEFLKKISTNNNFQKQLPLLLESKNLTIKGCFFILNQASESSNPEILTAAWELFWNVYMAKQVLDEITIEHHAIWRLMIALIAKDCPDRYFYILSNLDNLIKTLNYQFYNVVMLTNYVEELLLRSLQYFVELEGQDKQQRLLKWVSAEIKLEQYYSDNSSFLNSIFMPKCTAMILAGTPEDCDAGLNMIELKIKNLEENKLIDFNENISKYILILLSKIQNSEIKNFIEKQIALPFLEKSLKFLEGNQRFTQTIKSLYQFLYERHYKTHSMHLFNMILKNPYKPAVEWACLTLIHILKTETELALQERKTYSKYLNQFFTIVKQKKYYFSLNFYNETTKVPYLDKEMIGYPEITSELLLDMTTFNTSCFSFVASEGSIYIDLKDVKKKAIYIQAKQAMLDLNMFYLPQFCVKNDFRDLCFTNIMYCLMPLLSANYNSFEEIYYAFKNEALKKYPLLSFTITAGLIRSLVNLGFSDWNSFCQVATLIGKELRSLVNMQEATEESLKLIRDFYYIFIDIGDKDIDPFNTTYSEPFLLETKKLFVKIIKSRYINDNAILFKYSCLLENYESDMIELSNEEIQYHFKALVDELASKPPSYSTVRAILDLSINVPKAYPLTYDNVHHSWLTAIELAPKAKYNPKLQNTVFALLIETVIGSNAFKNPTFPMGELAVDICKAICRELTSKVWLFKGERERLSFYEVFYRTANFLIRAVKADIFTGQYDAFYQIVESIITNLNPHLIKVNLISANEVFKELLNAPAVKNPEKIEKIKQLWALPKLS